MSDAKVPEVRRFRLSNPDGPLLAMNDYVLAADYDRLQAELEAEKEAHGLDVRHPFTEQFDELFHEYVCPEHGGHALMCVFVEFGKRARERDRLQALVAELADAAVNALVWTPLESEARKAIDAALARVRESGVQHGS